MRITIGLLRRYNKLIYYFFPDNAQKLENIIINDTVDLLFMINSLKENDEHLIPSNILRTLKKH